MTHTTRAVHSSVLLSAGRMFSFLAPHSKSHAKQGLKERFFKKIAFFRWSPAGAFVPKPVWGFAGGGGAAGEGSYAG
jgi:hypothetical protein